MCLVLEILMLVFGIVTMITGKFTLTRSKIVRGTPARIVAGIMLLPLPLALVVGVPIVATILAKRGDEDKARLIGTIVEASIVLICFIAAMTTAAIYAGPPPKKRRPRRDEEDEEYKREEDDRPRPPARRVRRPPDDRIQE